MSTRETAKGYTLFRDTPDFSVCSILYHILDSLSHQPFLHPSNNHAPTITQRREMGASHLPPPRLFQSRPEIHRERLGDELFAAVVVMRGVALEPVERLARTRNRLAGCRRKIPNLRTGPFSRAVLVLLLEMQEAAIFQDERTVERLCRSILPELVARRRRVFMVFSRSSTYCSRVEEKVVDAEIQDPGFIEPPPARVVADDDFPEAIARKRERL